MCIVLRETLINLKSFKDLEKSIQHIKQINRRVGDRLTDDCGVRERQVRKYLVVDPWRIPGTLQESDSHEETPQQSVFSVILNIRGKV